MNILMIFRNHPFEASGAVTLDLFNDFKAKGHNVKLLVNKYSKDYPEGIVSMETAYLFWKNRVVYKLKTIFKLHKKDSTNHRYHFHEIDEQQTFYSTASILKKAGMKPDAIIILFAGNFINSKNIYELNQRTGTPVYWMMYDTSPLTGGCHYSWDCKGYQNSCGSCPGLFSKDPHDKTYKNLQFKKQYMDKTDISIVLASEWQNQQAQKSSVFKNHPVHKIFISINPEVFKPVAKNISHPKVGIPEGKKVIFFGAKSFNDERKGFQYLREALETLKKMLINEPDLLGKVFLLIAGEETNKIGQLPFESLNLGMLDNNYGVASAYQAADLYVCPSIEDAGPSMVNQSIMCGTPVVSFAQGVSLDLVITGKTGYRVKMNDSADMAKGIYEILRMTDEEHTHMKNNCREMGLELFHPEVSINNWLKIIGAN
ncbi:hypothetical protein BH11BAC4_BH11BAC4_04460 [soil metagenome]